MYSGSYTDILKPILMVQQKVHQKYCGIIEVDIKKAKTMIALCKNLINQFNLNFLTVQIWCLSGHARDNII